MGKAGAVLILALWLTGCPRQDEVPDDLQQACAAACAAFVSADCDSPGLARTDHRSCVASCRAREPALRQAACLPQRIAYLACVSRAPIDCAQAQCSAGVCLEQGSGVADCRTQHDALQACQAPCEGAGTIHVGEIELAIEGQPQRVQAQVERRGCAGCLDPLRKGAPTGSRCELYSVCSEHCCRCPNSRASYTARVCQAATCVGPNEACKLARQAVPSDPCRQ